LAFDESTSFTPPAAFGPYRVLHQIGSGVLGPVFRTYDPQQDRLVAVKAFRLDVVPEAVAELAGHLRRLPASGLTHPGLVPVLDAGLEGMSAYLAMEYVSAETLDVALRHLAPSPLDRALPILVDLAKAIEAGWAAGFGHGALHPRDVFVLSGTNEVRLTGWGVVPALESAGIKVPTRRPYSAPERGSGSWDVRADIYSLGVLAHELLTKRRPGGANEQDGSLVTGTSPEARVQIRRVLAAALADRPDERFATPTAFVDALGAIVRGEPLGALPAGASGADERSTPASSLAHAAPAKKAAPPLLAISEAPAVTDAEAPAEPVWAPVTPAPPVKLVPAPVLGAPTPPAPPPPAPVVIPTVSTSPPATPVASTPASESAASVTPPRSIAPSPVRRVAKEPSEPSEPSEPRAVRPAPPPMRVSPPPVIVPVRGPFPWAAVIAAAVAGSAVTGVIGYRIGLGQRPTPVLDSAALSTASSASATPQPPPGTDVTVPPPLTAPPPVTAAQSGAPAGGSATPPAATPPSAATPAPEAKPAPPPASSSAASHAPSRASSTAKPASTSGSLLVETRPAGARVVLDGKSLGVTPLTIPDVHVGKHPLRIERSGYKTLVTDVIIKSGERYRVAVTLELSGAPGPWMPRLR
jgi:serine/threonine-protein kinase